jgi:asparagine synthase (glutamine-hydrolysing)
MRAFAGLTNFAPALDHEVAIHRMLSAMALRPPDRRGLWADGDAGLGTLFQNLVPEDGFDMQPLRSGTGAALVATTALLNNRDELAFKLGWTEVEAAARADSAFVLAAYEKWGEACLLQLNGAFALAVWHPRERRLFCAVDPFGAHPLYFWQRSGRLAFASTLRGLLALPEVSRALDEETFAEHVAGVRHVSGRTFYRDIARLNAAESLHFSASGIRRERYWQPSPVRELRLGSDSEYQEAFRAELAGAVRRSLRGPPGQAGVLLSGGLDSSAVTVVAARILAERGRRLQCIHAVPAADGRYHAPQRQLDETHYVRLLQARSPEIDFHFLPATSHVAPRDAWDGYFSDHLVPFSSLPLLRDRERAARLDPLGLRLMMTGVGGNTVVSLEALDSGYLAHLARSARWLAWWREARGHSRVFGVPLRRLARQTVLRPLGQALRSTPGSAYRQSGFTLLHPSIRARTGIEGRFLAQARAASRPAWDFRRLLADRIADGSLHQTGASPSTITREPGSAIAAAPLCDRRLNEFCLALPFEQQIRDGWDRRLLRESMRGLLPDEVRLRVTRGFPQPSFQRHFAEAEPTLRTELDRLASSAIVAEYFDFPRLRALWDTRNANPTWGRDLLLVRAVAAAAFLEWWAK